MTRLTSRPPEALLRVRVHPLARRSEVLGWRDGVLRVKVAAPPSEGRANEAVIDLLSHAFAVPRSSVALIGGAGSRDKLFRIGRRSLDELRAMVAVSA
jgi:uncharacterized protein